FAAVPLTASLFTHVFLGSVVIAPLAFGLRLFLIIAGSAAAAAIIRRLAGHAVIEAQRERIDGLNVIAFVMFAIAAMDGIPAHFMAAPLLVAELTGLAFLLAHGQMVVTALVFGRAGGACAFAIGLRSEERRVGE